MIFVFDCTSGLCNQIHDIVTGISFCVHNNMPFTFRYASFRNDDLISWFNTNFENLFDTSFLKKIRLYIDIDILNLNEENTLNYNSDTFLRDLLPTINSSTGIQFIKYLDSFGKHCVVIKQPWCLNKFQFDILDLYNKIKPSKKILNIYNDIKKELYLDNQTYNFIHYRYEHDFINFFNITDNKSLYTVIKTINFNKKLCLYIATTNIENILTSDDLNDLENLNIKILYKDEKKIKDLNFEELAFIDYTIGINAEEIYGHSKSSFSYMLNKFKNTQNYYDV